MAGLADRTEQLAAIIRAWNGDHLNVGVTFTIVTRGVIVVVTEDGQPALLKRKDTFDEALQQVIDYIKTRPDPIGAIPRRVA